MTDIEKIIQNIHDLVKRPAYKDITPTYPIKAVVDHSNSIQDLIKQANPAELNLSSLAKILRTTYIKDQYWYPIKAGWRLGYYERIISEAIMIVIYENLAGQEKESTKKDIQLQSKQVPIKGNSYITTFGRNLDTHKTELGYSNEELAKKLGVTKKTIHNQITKGMIPRSSVQKKRYADFFSKALGRKIRALDLGENSTN
jgi:DNA-binding XRE family transcriptional regulator